MIVRYKPLVLPTFLSSLKCSINISIQNNICVFVEENRMKDIATTIGLLEVMIPTRDNIFMARSPRVNRLFPKYFRTFALLDRSKRVAIEAKVYNIPTYFSDIIFDRKVEFIYAERAMCSVKMNDNIYILFIFLLIIF